MMSHDNHDTRMMWFMIIACAVPVVFIMLASGGLTSRNWLLVMGGIAIFIIAHALLVRRRPGEHHHIQMRDDGSDSSTPHDKK